MASVTARLELHNSASPALGTTTVQAQTSLQSAAQSCRARITGRLAAACAGKVLAIQSHQLVQRVEEKGSMHEPY